MFDTVRQQIWGLIFVRVADECPRNFHYFAQEYVDNHRTLKNKDRFFDDMILNEMQYYIM